jgi:hypothetical protein
MEQANAVDSTGNGNDGTGGTADASGKLGGAQEFGGTQHTTIPNSATVGPGSEITVSAWFNGDTFSNRANPGIFAKKSSWGGVWVQNNSKIWGRVYQSNGTAASFAAAYTITTGAWHYTNLVANATDGLAKQYVDTALAGSVSYNGTLKVGTDAFTLGYQSGEIIDGRIDEVRLSSVARSTDWIAGEYANQNDPGTFYSVGTQEEDGSEIAAPRTLRRGRGVRLNGGVRLH